MQISFSIAEEELVEVLLHFSTEQATYKKAIKRLRIVYIVLIVMLILLTMVFLISRGGIDFSIALLLGLIIFLGVFYFMLPQFLERQIRKSLTQTLRETSKGEVRTSTITLTDDRLINKSNGAVREDVYSNLGGAGYFNDVLLVYLASKADAYIIPLNAFENQAHQEEFVAFLNEKIHSQRNQRNTDNSTV